MFGGAFSWKPDNVRRSGWCMPNHRKDSTGQTSGWTRGISLPHQFWASIFSGTHAMIKLCQPQAVFHAAIVDQDVEREMGDVVVEPRRHSHLAVVSNVRQTLQGGLVFRELFAGKGTFESGCDREDRHWSPFSSPIHINAGRTSTCSTWP